MTSLAFILGVVPLVHRPRAPAPKCAARWAPPSSRHARRDAVRHLPDAGVLLRDPVVRRLARSPQPSRRDGRRFARFDLTNRSSAYKREPTGFIRIAGNPCGTTPITPKSEKTDKCRHTLSEQSSLTRRDLFAVRAPVDLSVSCSSAGSRVGSSAPTPALRSCATASKLIVHTAEPLNAEPRLDESSIRGSRPSIASTFAATARRRYSMASAFRLAVEGEVERPLSFRLTNCVRSRARRLVATLTCAGNRRNEHSAVKPVFGVQWQAGTSATRRWEGVLSLADLLAKAGIRPAPGTVSFESVDVVKKADGTTFSFGGSVPIKKSVSIGKRRRESCWPIRSTRSPCRSTTVSRWGRAGIHRRPKREVADENRRQRLAFAESFRAGRLQDRRDRRSR